MDKLSWAREKVALAWCTKENASKIMDTDLAEAFTEILHKECAQPRLGYATTKMLLEELWARIEVDGKLDYKTVGE